MSDARFLAIGAAAALPLGWGVIDVALAGATRHAFDPRILVLASVCLAPLGLVAALVVAVVVDGARDRGDRRRLTALGAVGELLAFALLVAGAAALDAWVSGRPLAGIRTPRFAAILAWGTIATSLLGAAILGPMTLAPLAHTWSRTSLVRRRVVSTTILVIGAVAAFTVRGALAALPAHTLVAGAGAVVLVFGIAVLARRARHVRPVASTLLVLLGVATITAPILPRSLGAARASAAQTPGIVGLSTRTVTWLLDVDRDGAAGGAFGEDCAPFDASRGPFAREIPGNGADEDCSGIDLVLPEGGVRRGDPRSGARPAGIAPTPNIVLVTTDALTFAHTTLGGYHASTTPSLAAFASRATHFVNAFSTSSATCNAIPSLFTGRLALASPGLLPPEYQDPPGGAIAPTLAEVLRAAGYRTVALVGARLFSRASWPELGRGFDVVETPGLDDAAGDKSKYYLAEDLTTRALAEIQRDDPRPLFLWVHFFDHHAPHGLPPDTKVIGDGRSELSRYDTELAFADRAWGRLFEGIAATWPADRALTIFTSDHGEAFDANHDLGRHETSLRTAEVHVPFVVQAPFGRGEIRRGLVTHLDVMATLVDLVVPDRSLVLDGESLLPSLAAGREPRKRVAFSILWQPRLGPVGAPALRSAAIRTAEDLYIDDREHQTRALYAWPEDPLERTDVTAHRAGAAEWMRHALAEELERAREAAR